MTIALLIVFWGFFYGKIAFLLHLKLDIGVLKHSTEVIKQTVTIFSHLPYLNFCPKYIQNLNIWQSYLRGSVFLKIKKVNFHKIMPFFPFQLVGGKTCTFFLGHQISFLSPSKLKEKAKESEMNTFLKFIINNFFFAHACIHSKRWCPSQSSILKICY